MVDCSVDQKAGLWVEPSDKTRVVMMAESSVARLAVLSADNSADLKVDRWAGNSVGDWDSQLAV